MSTRFSTRWFLFLLVGMLSFAESLPVCSAAEILVADRLTNSVFRYSTGGVFLGKLLTDNVNLNQPAGIQVSPDHTKLYVASSQNNKVVEYDYNYAAGTATNPTTFATTGLSFPNSIVFNAAGDKIYVSNLGGTGVTQFNLDGTSAGPAINGVIAGGSMFQFSGMAYAPTGELLVGAFQDFPAGANGGVARSNAAISSISDFIGPSAAINGAAGLLTLGNDLYASGLFSGAIHKYNATTGAMDGSFNLTGLAFPQGIIAAPDGNGLLVSILGFAAGSGNISRYGFDGAPLGVFASAQANPLNGFTEATSMVVVPEPTTLGLLGIALATLGFAARRRLVGQC